MIQNQTGPQSSMPVSYNQDYIRIVPKDPYTLYAYWEITTSTRINFINAFGESLLQKAKPTLRVYNLSSERFDYMEIDQDTSSCYINIKHPGSTVKVEIGNLVAQEFFISIASSNLIHMPDNRILYDDCIQFTNVKESKNIADNIDTDQIYKKFKFNDVAKILGPSSVEYPKYSDEHDTSSTGTH